jgi:DNA-binding transcriptional MerR regulator
MRHTLPTLYLRRKHARVCPECKRDRECQEAFWELRHAVGCHRHQRKAISRCPACDKELDWWRKGLTVCNCGHDFGKQLGEKITNMAMLTLLELMHAKLMDTKVDPAALAYVGFPVKAVNHLSLNTLLGIIHRLENYVEDTEATQGKEWLGLEAAAEVFSCWPDGFNRYLERVHAPNADIKVKGLRGQFESFYEALFKNGLPKDEVAFMHKAFIEFGEQHWKQAAIHPKFKPEKVSNIVGIEGLAKAAGIRPSTARKLVDKGVIPVHSQHRNGHRLFDLSEQMPFEFAKGSSLSLDAAAQRLDIPVAILRAYRKRGYYTARHLASPMALYHEQDIEALRVELIRNCTLMDIQENEIRYRTLRKIMLQKLGPSEVKAAFIDAVRKREIRPLGIVGNRPGDLVFDAKTVITFIESLNPQLEGLVSTEQACESLDINRSCLKALLKHNHLNYVHSVFGIRITEASLKLFSNRYSSCRQVAKLKGITQASILTLCKELRIEVMVVAAKGENGSPSFIDNTDLPLLGINLWEAFDEQRAA